MLDSRHITNKHHFDMAAKIRASHIITKGAVLKKNEDGVRVCNGIKRGNGNGETDYFYPLVPTAVRCLALVCILTSEPGTPAPRGSSGPTRSLAARSACSCVDARKGPYQWLAPADMEPSDGGNCDINQHVTVAVVEASLGWVFGDWIQG